MVRSVYICGILDGNTAGLVLVLRGLRFVSVGENSGKGRTVKAKQECPIGRAIISSGCLLFGRVCVMDADDRSGWHRPTAVPGSRVSADVCSRLPANSYRISYFDNRS